MQRYSGRRLRAARIITGLSRTVVAERCDITPNTLGAYERNGYPNADVLGRLADCLGVRVADFFDDVEEVA